jgi:hypothetical protein
MSSGRWAELPAGLTATGGPEAWPIRLGEPGEPGELGAKELEDVEVRRDCGSK